jgi:hypothetical protein
MDVIDFMPRRLLVELVTAGPSMSKQIFVRFEACSKI